MQFAKISFKKGNFSVETITEIFYGNVFGTREFYSQQRNYNNEKGKYYSDKEILVWAVGIIMVKEKIWVGKIYLEQEKQAKVVRFW